MKVVATPPGHTMINLMISTTWSHKRSEADLSNVPERFQRKYRDFFGLYRSSTLWIGQCALHSSTCFSRLRKDTCGTSKSILFLDFHDAIVADCLRLFCLHDLFSLAPRANDISPPRDYRSLSLVVCRFSKLYCRYRCLLRPLPFRLSLLATLPVFECRCRMLPVPSRHLRPLSLWTPSSTVIDELC